MRDKLERVLRRRQMDFLVDELERFRTDRDAAIDGVRAEYRELMREYAAELRKLRAEEKADGPKLVKP